VGILGTSGGLDSSVDDPFGLFYRGFRAFDVVGEVRLIEGEAAWLERSGGMILGATDCSAAIRTSNLSIRSASYGMPSARWRSERGRPDSDLVPQRGADQVVEIRSVFCTHSE
jgi:hypothetical protein